MSELYLVKSLLQPITSNLIFIDFINKEVLLTKQGIEISIYNENEKFDLKQIVKKFKEIINETRL